jgi:hypothetical protein
MRVIGAAARVPAVGAWLAPAWIITFGWVRFGAGWQ